MNVTGNPVNFSAEAVPAIKFELARIRKWRGDHKGSERTVEYLRATLVDRLLTDLVAHGCNAKARAFVAGRLKEIEQGKHDARLSGG